MRRDPDRDDAALLWYIIESSRLLIEYTRGRTREQYTADRLLRDAVERRIMIVGEAAWKLSDEFKTSVPQLPWNRIVTQRHRIVHDYMLLDDALLWDVVTVHIPELLRTLEPLLPPPPPEPPEDAAARPE